MNDNNCCQIKNIKYVPFAVLILGLFLVVQTIIGLKDLGKSETAVNTISVQGKGEIVRIPDTAIFSVSVTKEGKTVQDAQNSMTAIMNPIIEAVKSMGVNADDIKTDNYSINPSYEYQQAVCTTSYCPPGKQVLKGYEASQSIQVKVKKTDTAGAILTKVGSLGATNVSGLTFTIDNPDTVKADARNLAITSAKEKAKVLAKNLGVNLGRVVSFNEVVGGYYPYETNGIMAAKAMGSADVANIPVGDTKVTSNVTVVYEIR